MRVANIVSGLISALWFALFVMGRGIIHEAYLQEHVNFPSAEQVDYYMIYPLLALVLILLASLASNIWRKPVVALAPAIVIGFAILPFLFVYTGGM